MTPRHIRQAARIIRRVFIVPYRQRKLARAMGVDDLVTRFDVAKRQHKPTKLLQREIAAACRAQLEREVAR